MNVWCGVGIVDCAGDEFVVCRKFTPTAQETPLIFLYPLIVDGPSPFRLTFNYEAPEYELSIMLLYLRQ